MLLALGPVTITAVSTNYQTMIIDTMRRLNAARRELIALKNGEFPQ